MSKERKRFRLRLKTKGIESYCDFISKLSTDTVFKKKVDKAMFLNFAIVKADTSRDGFFKGLDAIFQEGQIHTESELFYNKYAFYKKNFNEKKLKNSWHIHLKYFEWVPEHLEDNDHVFFPDKKNPGQFIKEVEFKYMAYKLTDVLIKNRGYNTISRSFFLNKELPAYKDYYKATGRKITKGKLAYMTNILSKRDLIYCYRRPNKTNLFVVGKNNPYFQLYNVVTNEDISNLYTTYKIDTTRHYKRQVFGKNLIPEKIEKEFCKKRLAELKASARDEFIMNKIEKENQKISLAYDKKPEYEYKHDEMEEEQIIHRKKILEDFCKK